LVNVAAPAHFSPHPQSGDARALTERVEREMAQGFRHSKQPYPYYPQFDVEPGETEKFDVYKYLRIILKYRWLIGCMAIAALLIAAVVTFLMTPIYRATSSIQIDRETVDVVDVKGVQAEQDPFAADFYQTKYELLASRSLAERVVNTLDLSNDKAFQAQGKSFKDNLSGLVFGSSKTEDMTGDSDSRNRGSLSTLTDNITIAPVRGSRIVRISFDHPNAAVATKIANGFAEVFIADNLDRRYDATSYARKFLEERLQQLRVKLEESEKQLVLYAEQKGIINLTDDKNLAVTDLEAINTKLAEAHAQRVKSELLWKRAKVTDGFGLKEILESPAIQENRKQRAALAAQYQQKLAIFRPAFPEMIQLRNQIAELDHEAQIAIKAIKGSIESSYLAAKQEEEALRAQLGQTKTDVVQQRNSNIDYTILKREVDTNRTLYDGLLQRYKEIGVAGAVSNNNISVVDTAAMPRSPRSPNLSRNLALGLLAGLLLGLMAAFALDYMDDSFKSPEDIERSIGLSVIGVIPKPSAGFTVDEEVLNARSGMAEAIRSLRTGLQFATSDGLPKTLLVTSSKPSEGKTTTSIALAKSLANIGLNVLLIDGDLRNASVHRRLNCSNELGLSNYLSGKKLPEEVVQSTDTEGLVVMASGPLPPNPAELLSGPRFMSLLTLGQQSFDIVVIDGPPVMGLADAPLLSSMARATLLVVAAGETRRNTAKVALKRIQYARGNVIGALLSKFDVKQAGYGYGYGYGDYEYHSYGLAKLPGRAA
jgi:polysaccharide biosynthesis transport protein